MKQNHSFFRNVCNLAIPVALQSMLQSSFGIVDQIMIGQLGSVNIAGVGLAVKFSGIFSVVVAALGAVAGIMISQYLGQQDRIEVKRSFFLNLYFALGPVHRTVPPFSGTDHGILHDRSRHACCHRRLSPDPLRHLFLHGLRDHAVRFVTLYGKGLSAAICQLSCCCRQHCPELSSDFRQIWFSRHGNCRRRHRHGDLTVSQSGADVFYGHQAVSPVLSLWGVFLPQSPFQLETICLHPASNTGL